MSQAPVFMGMRSRLDRIEDWEARVRGANYRVGNLARILNVTPRQLERYFLKTRDCHPRDWIRDLRMKDALRLKRHGFLDKEIAAQLGFKYASDFSRALRQYHDARKGSRSVKMDK
jgi:transcriptional regulator GlxA family with amidase domain